MSPFSDGTGKDSFRSLNILQASVSAEYSFSSYRKMCAFTNFTPPTPRMTFNNKGQWMVNPIYKRLSQEIVSQNRFFSVIDQLINEPIGRLVAKQSRGQFTRIVNSIFAECHITMASCQKKLTRENNKISSVISETFRKMRM